MTVVTDDRTLEAAPRPSRPALILTAAAALCLVAAGLLLWGRHGGAVFGDVVLAGLAWCF